MRVEYYAYINSKEWRQRADEAKRRAGYRCQVCNEPSPKVILNAHHRTYERLGHEHPDDITVLCRDCHELYELNKKIPKPPRRKPQPGIIIPPYARPVTPTPIQPTVSYPVNQGKASKEPVLPTKLS
jgi:hypothetical protein